MLLVKYERFDIIAKDDYVEELLFKYEKNVGHFQTFDKKGKAALLTMAEMVDASESVTEIFGDLNEQYQTLIDVAHKLKALKLNQEFVYKTLTKATNKKL